jgi:hypothetical protein
LCAFEFLNFTEDRGWLKNAKNRQTDRIRLLPGFMVAVLAEKDNATNQSFWLAEVTEIHPRQDDGSRSLSAVWFESAKEFGSYRRCRGRFGKEMQLDLTQCLFWFNNLTARGAIPKEYHQSIKAALQFGVDVDEAHQPEDDQADESERDELELEDDVGAALSEFDDEEMPAHNDDSAVRQSKSKKGKIQKKRV